MSETLLYQKVLGLKAPWLVSKVQLDEEHQRIIVVVDYVHSGDSVCPVCQGLARHYDSRPRTWRHLDTCQFETIIHSNVPRIHCPNHGYQTLQVPWAHESSRYTELLEMRVLAMLAMSTLNAVSKFFKLSWGAIDRIMERAVSRGLAHRTACSTESLLIDETAIKKGHDYVTVLSNSQGQVLAVSDGRSKASFNACFAQLPSYTKSQTKTICMDMSPAYISAAKAAFPDAEKRIAFDHFHIAKLLTEAVNAIRRDEIYRLSPSMRQEAHRTRFFWLKQRHNLSADRKERLNKLVPR